MDNIIAHPFEIETAGDPSALTLLPQDSVLSKKFYPYQTIERYFKRPAKDAPLLISVQFDVPFSAFKKLLDKNGISFYIGSDATK